MGALPKPAGLAGGYGARLKGQVGCGCCWGAAAAVPFLWGNEGGNDHTNVCTYMYTLYVQCMYSTYTAIVSAIVKNCKVSTIVKRY